MMTVTSCYVSTLGDGIYADLDREGVTYRCIAEGSEPWSILALSCVSEVIGKPVPEDHPAWTEAAAAIRLRMDQASIRAAGP